MSRIIIEPQEKKQGKYIAKVGEHIVGDNYTTLSQANKAVGKYLKGQGK